MLVELFDLHIDRLLFHSFVDSFVLQLFLSQLYLHLGKFVTQGHLEPQNSFLDYFDL